MSEQFENSIRKKLEEVDIPFDPAAWEKMKKRLDDSDRRRPVFWWWTSGLLLLLLLGGGGWWFYAQQDHSTTVLQNVPVEKTTTAPEAVAGNTPAITGAVKVTPPSENTEKENIPNKTTLASEDQPATKGSTINKSTSNEPTTNKSNISKSTTNEPITTSANNSTATEKQELTPLRYDIQPILFNQLQKISIPANVNNFPVINIPTDTTANNYTKKTARPKKRKSGFEGGITLGPDYNIAPSFKMGKLGFNGGLLLRYHVNNRLSLSIAAVYAKKLYGATPKDYKFDYPTNYVKINADCNVLDVPLNVHYKFLDLPKSSWSAMAGASSYFMLKEKYDYYWANNTKRTREFSNQNQHYFSVLNLGVTYERKTAGRLKWGLQPYVKVPMAGVGEGKVKLSSAGVSLQLTLGKKD